MDGDDGTVSMLSPLNVRTPDPLVIHLPGGAVITLNPPVQDQPETAFGSGSSGEFGGTAVPTPAMVQLAGASAGQFAPLAGIPETTSTGLVSSPKYLAVGGNRLAASNQPGTAEVHAQQPQNELSFAARVEPVSEVSKPSDARGGASGQASTDREFDNIARAVVDEKSGPAGSAPKAAEPVAPWSLAPNGPAVETAPDSGPAAGQGTGVSSVQAHEPPKAVTPLKDISLQVGQTPEQRVEVRIVERSGELRVAVRTPDADLAHGLRQGLSEVVGRLSESGFRTETWHPGGTTGQVASTARSAETSADTPQQDSQGRGNTSHQEQQRHGNQQSNRPEWLDELDGTMSRNKSTGDTYGFGS